MLWVCVYMLCVMYSKLMPLWWSRCSGFCCWHLCAESCCNSPPRSRGSCCCCCWPLCVCVCVYLSLAYSAQPVPYHRAYNLLYSSCARVYYSSVFMGGCPSAPERKSLLLSCSRCVPNRGPNVLCMRGERVLDHCLWIFFCSCCCCEANLRNIITWNRKVYMRLNAMKIAACAQCGGDTRSASSTVAVVATAFQKMSITLLCDHRYLKKISQNHRESGRFAMTRETILK